MKKLNMLLMAILFLIGAVGCASGGKGEEPEPSKIQPTAKKVMDKIQEKLAESYNLAVINGVLSDATTEEPLYNLMDIKSKKDTEFFASAENFNLDDIKEGYILEPIDASTDAELIILVEANDKDATNNVNDAMQKVLSDQHELWSDHIGDQYQIVKGNRIEKQGNFVLYVTSKKQTEIIKVFQDQID